MRRIMGISLSLIALLAVAAIAFVALQGARLFTPHLEAAASRALARPVAIEGSLALRWSPAPSLVVEGLRIGDGQDATSADLLRIERLEVRPALGPLLRGKIELDEVSLADATIAAALFTRAPPGQTEPTGNSGSGGRGALVPRIGILRAERLRLELPRLEGGSPRRVEITRLEASVSDQNDRMELDASGILEGTEWTLRFGLTPLSGLVTRASVELSNPLRCAWAKTISRASSRSSWADRGRGFRGAFRAGTWLPYGWRRFSPAGKPPPHHAPNRTSRAF